MKDCTQTVTTATAPAVLRLRTAGSEAAVSAVQPDEFLRRARIATAQAAVDGTAKRLAGTYLPFGERWDLAREHEANRMRLAEARTAGGVATLHDVRLLAPQAAQVAEDSFWSSGDSWEAAGARLQADVTTIAAGLTRTVAV